MNSYDLYPKDPDHIYPFTGLGCLWCVFSALIFACVVSASIWFLVR